MESERCPTHGSNTRRVLNASDYLHVFWSISILCSLILDLLVGSCRDALVQPTDHEAPLFAFVFVKLFWSSFPDLDPYELSSKRFFENQCDVLPNKRDYTEEG